MSIPNYVHGAQVIIAQTRPVLSNANRVAPADRFALATQFAIEKALAHVDDPFFYPLPDDPASPENVLVSRLQRIPPLRRRRIVKSALHVFREQRRRMWLGPLSCIDLGSREPVLAQIKSQLPESIRLTDAEERRLIDHIASINGDFGLTYLWAIA